MIDKEGYKEFIELTILQIDDLKKEIERLESKITEERIAEKFTYDDKELLQSAKDLAISKKSYSISRTIERAMKKLKEVKYPEITGVKYYKKYIDQLETPLSEEQKIELDRELSKLYHPGNINCSLRISSIKGDIQTLLLNELFEMGLIHPTFFYYFDCDCMSSDSFILGNIACGSTIYSLMSVEEGNDEELIERIEDSGRSCDGCGAEWNDDRLILEDLKESFASVSCYNFKVAIEPDTTLDEL